MLHTSAPARIRKGQGAEALNRALCVALRKLGYTGVGVGVEGDDHPLQRVCVWGGGGVAYTKNIHTPKNTHLPEKKNRNLKF